MRWFVLLLSILMMQFEVHSGVIKLDLKKDFGAKGDGRTDDSKAWSDALNYVSNKSSDGSKNVNNINYSQDQVILFIPKGVYRVGAQDVNTSRTPQPRYANNRYKNLISGIKGKGLIIEGETNRSGQILSTFKILDNVKYGYYDFKTGNITSANATKNQAMVGTVISIAYGTENVTIKNLELDGNFDKIQYQALKGGRGSDIIYSGIVTSGVTGLLIENLHVHHFGLDGITLQGLKTKSKYNNGYNIVVRNVISEYNSRQGLTFGLGSGLLVQNSTFRYTGVNRAMRPPAANVDIENHDKSGDYISDVVFENCILSDNTGGSGSLTIAGKVKGVKFYNTKIHTGSNGIYAIQTNYSSSRDFYFEDCEITGNIIMYNASKTMLNDGITTFRNCTFKDNNNFSKHSADKPFLWIHDKVSFINCDFFTQEKRVFLKSQPDKSNKLAPKSVIFQNCKFKNANTNKDSKSQVLKNINNNHIIVK